MSMAEQIWFEVTDEHQKQEGGERWVRHIDPVCWISASYRLTGFGWREWETAIVFVRDDSDPKKYARGKWDDREVLIVGGDRREELATMPKEQLREWYAAKIDGNRNSFETILQAVKSST